MWPTVQGLLRGLVVGRYWGARVETKTDLAHELGVSEGHLDRILDGSTGFQARVVNKLIPLLGRGARLALQAPLCLKNDQDPPRLARYRDAPAFYRGWAAVAKRLDWSCPNCLPRVQLHSSIWFLSTQLRAPLAHPPGRTELDKWLAELPECPHHMHRGPNLHPYMERYRRDHQSYDEAPSNVRYPTLQGLLRILIATGALTPMHAPKMGMVAVMLGYSTGDFLSDVLRGNRDVPETVINQLLEMMDPLRHIVFEAVDEFRSELPVMTLEQAPDWYNTYAQGLNGLWYDVRVSGLVREGSEFFLEKYQELRRRLHLGSAFVDAARSNRARPSGPASRTSLIATPSVTEPPREKWRLHSVRGWSHEQTRQVPARGAGARGADGPGTPRGVSVGVGGDHLNRRQAGRRNRGAAAVAAAGRGRPAPTARHYYRGAGADPRAGAGESRAAAGQ